MADITTVKGSTGQPVIIEIKNVTEVMKYLRELGYIPTDKAGMFLLQAGNFVQRELQASIAGERGEPRSVRTGRLANNIIVEPVKISEGYVVKVMPSPYETYPEGVTTKEVAIFLEEYRHHVGNTRERTRQYVIDILKGNIKEAIRASRS